MGILCVGEPGRRKDGKPVRLRTCEEEARRRRGAGAMAETSPLAAIRHDEEMKLTASELEFLAEDELVDVVPRFSFSEVCPSHPSIPPASKPPHGPSQQPSGAVQRSGPESWARLQVHLTGGTYGPFVPMVPTKAPLWFAVQLVQRNLGKVQPPAWLHEDAVEDLWQREDRSRDMQLLQEVSSALVVPFLQLHKLIARTPITPGFVV